MRSMICCILASSFVFLWIDELHPVFVIFCDQGLLLTPTDMYKLGLKLIHDVHRYMYTTLQKKINFTSFSIQYNIFILGCISQVRCNDRKLVCKKFHLLQLLSLFKLHGCTSRSITAHTFTSFCSFETLIRLKPRSCSTFQFIILFICVHSTFSPSRSIN